MYNNISPFISVYRKNYNMQHVMITLLGEKRENLGKNWRGTNGPIQSFWLCSSPSFTCKLAAYGLDGSFLCYIDSYLLNRKQCVRINNINSDFLNVISGVPQGSIVGPILFNCFFNDFFWVTEFANAHNFANDNTLTALANNIWNLIHLLESECSVTVKRFRDNKMIVNPGKLKPLH